MARRFQGSRASNRRKKGSRTRRPMRRKVCPFTAAGIKHIDYKDVNTLKRYINEKGKIVAQRTTGLSSKYQRLVAIAIKRAREMALLPYGKVR